MANKNIQRKVNSTDMVIKIRILRALSDIKPMGTFKHFNMIKILRSMKKPNVITSIIIWNFLNEYFPEEKYAVSDNNQTRISFDKIFTE